MTARENGGFVSCKKFKSSHQKNEETRIGRAKGLGEGEAGNYFLGPVVKEYVTAPVTQCLARKKGTDEYYLMKILLLDDGSDPADKSSLERRTGFHNEYSFLSLLKNHPGVIQLCDFFKDYVYEEGGEKGGKSKQKRICMALECLIPHGHHNPELIPLNHFLKEGRLSELEALYAFYNLLLTLEDLHSMNIVHRDLKFTSVILNRKTLKVKLINFYHAELVASNTKVTSNKCRVSSHFAHDATGGEGLLLKICDMCSAGVILFGMLNGICAKSEYSLVYSTCVSDGTKELLNKIQYRLEASEAVDMVCTLLAVLYTSQNPSLFMENESSDQVVPECPNFDSKDEEEECLSAANKRSDTLSETSEESEGSTKSASEKPKGERVGRLTEETFQRAGSAPPCLRPSQQSGLLTRKEIKYAMLRLGVTSVNNINALSFNYGKKNSCSS